MSYYMSEHIGLKVHESDNIATLFCDGVQAGGEVTVIDPRGVRSAIQIKQDIPYGHKVALAVIETGDKILKYGEVIGTASHDIAPGDYVHIHNLDSTRGRGDLVKGGIKA